MVWPRPVSRGGGISTETAVAIALQLSQGENLDFVSQAGLSFMPLCALQHSTVATLKRASIAMLPRNTLRGE